MRAGVLAALRRRGHDAVLVTPGTRPTDALSALGQAVPASTVLAVDQAEEAWTMCDDADERRAFLEALVAEAGRRQVVLAIRGDHLTRATEHPAFGRLVEKGLHLVGAMSDDGLREAVERPAQQAGLVIEPGLVDLLVREVRDDPGALPLLSHALLETWHRREGNTLTVDGYRASGGIHGAVAQSAEDLYARMDADQRRRLRDLVLRLVSPGVEGEPVRTRVPRRLVAADTEHDRLIDSLVAARLVTSDGEALEITHEALARAWPRLRGWLEDDLEGQRIRHHLSGAADAWDGLGRPDSELYRGIRLTRALDWAASTQTVLVDTERAFLEAARVRAEIEERSAAERVRVQARLIRRLRIVLGGAVAILVLALAAGGVAAVQSDRANENAARAQQAAVSADARRVGGRAQLVDDMGLSLMLAAAGARLADVPETRANLVSALAGRPLLVRSAPPAGGFLEALVVSPDGRWVAASDGQNRMHLYDAATLNVEDSYVADRPLDGETGFMFAAFSPDSRTLAVGLEASESTEPVRLLDPDTMEPTEALAFPDHEELNVGDLQFSADGHHLAASVFPPGKTCCPSGASDRHGYALVWDLRDLTRRPKRIPTGIGLQGIAISPDGRTVYTAWPLSAYDVGSGERIWRRREVKTFFGSPDVNATGTLLALAEDGARDVLLVDARTGRTVERLKGHRDWAGDVRFSPDGSRLGSVSWADGELIAWETATGRPLHRWDTTDEYGVGFGPDNDLVYGGGADSMLRTWDLSLQDTYLEKTTQVGGGSTAVWAHISPDGRRVAYRWVDGRGRGWVRFVEVGSGKATAPTRLPAWRNWWWIPGAWEPEGEQYVGYCCYYQPDVGVPGTVHILDPVTGLRIAAERDVIEGDADITSIAYVLGGESLLVGDSEGTTTIIDSDTMQPDRVFEVQAHIVAPMGEGSTAVLFATSPVVGGGMSWRLVEVGTAKATAEGHLDHRAYATVASPDGPTVATAGETGEIVTIDVSTGAQRRSASHGVELRSIDWSDDGELLVSGAADGGVSLWDATTLDLMGTVHPPHRGKPVPSGVQFIDDTHDVVIASYDGTVYRWDTDFDRALDFACQMAGRDLTEEEWEQYLPAQPYRSVCPQ